jgi:hypothetical protein
MARQRTALRDRGSAPQQHVQPHHSSQHVRDKLVGRSIATSTYSAAYPFNIVTGGQTIQTTAARLPGAGRNTGVGFNYASLDLRLSRRVRVTDRVTAEVLAESFNTLNRTNLQFPNNTLGLGPTPLPTLGQPTAAADPRQIQFGLRFSF